MQMLQLSSGRAHLRAGRLEEAHTLAAHALAYFRTHQERGREANTCASSVNCRTSCSPAGRRGQTPATARLLPWLRALGMRPLQAPLPPRPGDAPCLTGQRGQACTKLATAVEMYRGMAMTFWLPETEAALAQVEGR